MDYKKQKDYYKTSYLNGVDIWTHLPEGMRGGKLIEKLKKDSLILDLGSGRGLIAKNLAEMGYRVIGIDFEKDVVAKANQEIKNWRLEGRLKYVEADVFELPFTDASFDGIYDFGLLENLFKQDWGAYANEINRVLKPGGYYINVSLSRKTKNFFDYSPINSLDGEFDKYDMHYHFFEKDEIKNIFINTMTMISDTLEFVESPRKVALLETLFQKKAQ